MRTIQTVLHNFNSGPSVLPSEVYELSARAIHELNDTGLSILETGHRTPAFIDIMEEARALVRELLSLDEEHEVLFLHGGATTQFLQVPMNLLDQRETAAYADTGVWSTKAIKEARLFGKVEVVCSSADRNYSYIPGDFAVPNDAKYFHITTNNTIFGTQWKNIPHCSIPLVADMSSDIMSRQLDFNRFDLIYAGAQKNIGAAGVTLVVVKKNILEKIKRPIPSIMNYANHIRENSLLNTPPVFAVYVAMLTLRWIRKSGGIPAMEAAAIRKSTMLYDEIDRNSLFTARAVPSDRSNMNISFVMNDDSLEKEFLDFTAARNITGIKGHRLSGGFRASVYNALPESSVEVLVQAMRDFEER